MNYKIIIEKKKTYKNFLFHFFLNTFYIIKITFGLSLYVVIESCLKGNQNTVWQKDVVSKKR